MDTVAFDSQGISCAAWHLSAQTADLATPAGRPCVVMGHGFGATRDAGLLPFAERFAAAGCDVFVFDYRGFGTSDGVPRQDIDHRRHRQDYHAAIAAARSLPGVDPARIALWGSSYSGGHVVVVGAQDDRVACVVSQGAAMDGRAALLLLYRAFGLRRVLALAGAGLRGLGRLLLGRRALLVPIVGSPQSGAVIAAPGAERGYQAIMGPTFRNEMCARGILRIALNRPRARLRALRHLRRRGLRQVGGPAGGVPAHAPGYATGVTSRRWLFGDHLGRHFLDDAEQPALIIESRAVFARRTFHRAKAHLVLSAMRHRAAELGEQCRYVSSGTYAEALEDVREPVTVCHPTTWAAKKFVESRDDVEVLPARGFVTAMEDFASWADGRGGKRLILEDFYRDARRRHDILMDGTDPAGGRWNFDADNREPPPKQATLGVDEPWWPREDEIDDEVRHDLDRWERDGDVSFIGVDGPRRFAATRNEALHALLDFLQRRLPEFGRHEDAMLTGDDWMAHSLLSAPLNLGLLDPLEVVQRAESAFRTGDAPIASAEGFVRQIMGWRDYVWHLYWYQGEAYRRS